MISDAYLECYSAIYCKNPSTHKAWRSADKPANVPVLDGTHLQIRQNCANLVHDRRLHRGEQLWQVSRLLFSRHFRGTKNLSNVRQALCKKKRCRWINISVHSGCNSPSESWGTPLILAREQRAAIVLTRLVGGDPQDDLHDTYRINHFRTDKNDLRVLFMYRSTLWTTNNFIRLLMQILFLMTLFLQTGCEIQNSSQSVKSSLYWPHQHCLFYYLFVISTMPLSWEMVLSLVLHLFGSPSFAYQKRKKSPCVDISVWWYQRCYTFG